MKLTPYKIARVLSVLPDEDRNRVKEMMKSEDGLDSETVSMLAKMHNAMSEGGNKKGSFGKRGTNRKEKLFLENLILSQLMSKVAGEEEKKYSLKLRDETDQ